MRLSHDDCLQMWGTLRVADTRQGPGDRRGVHHRRALAGGGMGGATTLDENLCDGPTWPDGCWSRMAGARTGQASSGALGRVVSATNAEQRMMVGTPIWSSHHAS
ncbi:hypothetical protein GCM10023086_68280 [Streptomyces venetus]|uniref:Uncharacterized protein n=1 Tax=Streptomyces venetus TaxID=1701086 RepID=A0ABP8H7Y4_9ACTN